MPDDGDDGSVGDRRVTPRGGGYVTRRVIVSARFVTRRVTRAATTRWDRWLGRFEQLGLSENATVLMFAIAVGLAAAAGVVVFYRAIDLVFELFFAWPARSFPGLSLFAYRPVVTGAGGTIHAAGQHTEPGTTFVPQARHAART